MKLQISCVICAYNEADRIGAVLSIVSTHPLISEVIVINDGSLDETEAAIKKFPSVQCITLPENKGKSFAMSVGIEASKEDTILLLDADLANLTKENVTALIEPVPAGKADVSLSLRGNSLGVYRLIGLDFVSGERVLPRSLLNDSLKLMKEMPRFGIETFMDKLIIENKLRVAVVDWPFVVQIRKSEKLGAVQGAIAEFKMLKDVFRTEPFWSLIKLNTQLLRLRVPASALPNTSAEALQE